MLFDEVYERFRRVYLEDRKDMYSWLTPSGEIIQLSYGECHVDCAARIVGSAKDSTLELFRRKYFRITYYSDSLYCHNPFTRPSTKQLSVLKNIAIENDMRSIRWDDEADDHALWFNDAA